MSSSSNNEYYTFTFSQGTVASMTEVDGRKTKVKSIANSEFSLELNAAGAVTDAKTLIGLQWLQNWRAGRWTIPGFAPR